MGNHGMIPMVRLDSVNTSVATTDADTVTTAFAGRQHHEKVVIFRKIESRDPISSYADTPERISLVTNGPTTTSAVAWMTAFCDRLVANGEDLYAIILEDERLASTFTMGNQSERTTNIQALFDDVGAAAMIPDEVKALTASSIANHSVSSTGSTSTYNQWMWYERTLAHRAILDAAETSLGHKVICNNFKGGFTNQDVRNIAGFNVWKSSINGYSAQDCYLEISGALISTATKNRRWNSLITQVNKARAHIAAGGVMMPWVSAPTNTTSSPGYDLPKYTHSSWRALIREIYSCGNIAGFLFFNPDGNPGKDDDDTFAGTVFRDLDNEPVVGVRGDLIIPLDADELPNTGIRYEDELPHMNPIWFG